MDARVYFALHADDEARTNKHSPSLLVREEGAQDADLQVQLQSESLQDLSRRTKHSLAKKPLRSIKHISPLFAQSPTRVTI